jgi:hypothetical protein
MKTRTDAAKVLLEAGWSFEEVAETLTGMNGVYAVKWARPGESDFLPVHSTLGAEAPRTMTGEEVDGVLKRFNAEKLEDVENPPKGG